jgi:tRNA-specific 2-thiouridylase
MSGGVDSSVAAAIMCENYGAQNVFGVTAKLFCYAEKKQNEKACCSLEAISDAKAVCDKLGIAHYVIDLSKEFKETVISDFISEYKKGHTPIPCIPCNKVIKFGLLLDKVKALGADKLVTGHYARIERGVNRYNLLRGVDKLKDQSYFLYNLSSKQLASIEFPVGGLKKAEVRKLATKYGLKTAKKRESQGICFITTGRVTDWLEGKIKNKPGKIKDTKGSPIGEHEGIVCYTVGQRKRIGGGFAEPMYVVDIDAKKNEVIIGREKDLYRKELTFTDTNWTNSIKLPLKCTAKIRYNMEVESCMVHKNNRVTFTKPQRAITPGQSVVFYQGDKVMGGGTISH